MTGTGHSRTFRQPYMKDMFPYIVLIDTIGRVGTITNSADSAYYTVELSRFAAA